MTKHPAIGQTMYLPARGSDMSPLLDHTGGLATIRHVEMGISAGERVPFVMFEGIPAISFNYNILLGRQDELSRLYAGSVSRHDPDYESNGDGFPRGF